MAVNPNFTNANAFTPYASGGGGGGSNFPLGISMGNTTYIRPDSFFSGNNNCIAVIDISSNLESRFVAGEVCAGTYTQGYLELVQNRITAYQPLTGTSKAFMNVNQSTLSNATPSFNLLNLSTLQSGSYIANATALFSSLQGTFPTSFQ
jgi:hypothetical protein